MDEKEKAEVERDSVMAQLRKKAMVDVYWQRVGGEWWLSMVQLRHNVSARADTKGLHECRRLVRTRQEWEELRGQLNFGKRGGPWRQHGIFGTQPRPAKAAG